MKHLGLRKTSTVFQKYTVDSSGIDRSGRTEVSCDARIFELLGKKKENSSLAFSKER